MLAECGLVSSTQLTALLTSIAELEASEFRVLENRDAPRGLFLLYEDFLIEELGPETGGVLQTARSRNDLNATVLRLRLRETYSALAREALRLQATLINRAERFAEVTMPVYTHFQAALPVTYGHYLAGVALALERDIEGLFTASVGIDDCPLGAGAAGGTSLPIRPARTAELLGFETAVGNSIDSVASRDFVLRLLAASTILGVTLSRLATDLLIWTTAEFGFINLPDELVGSSSMMPQKRNAYLLEHVQGRSAAVLGAFVASTTAMHAKPFTNSIAVGTEAMNPIWDALRGVRESATLVRLVAMGAKPDEAAMLRRAAEGFTSATELANRLVVERGMSFRSAHREVGSLIKKAVESSHESLEDSAARWNESNDEQVSLAGLDPSSVSRASEYGGGPGPEALKECVRQLRCGWSRKAMQLKQKKEQWARADLNLRTLADQLSITRTAAHE